MIVVVAIVLMIVPLGVVLICEKAAKRGRGPWAEPDRMTVLDGMIVSSSPTSPAPAESVATPEPVFTDPRDAERCNAESRLVRDLLSGKLDRSGYRSEMAALAAGTVSPPVRLPGEPTG